MEEAIDLLIKTDRIPEAAMLARTYAPDQISKIVTLWKSGLESKNRKKTAESLADPSEYPNLFPELLNIKKTQEESLLDVDAQEAVVEEEQEEPLVDAEEQVATEPEEEEAVEEEEPVTAEEESPSLI
jgi:coatomer subunit beta'